MTITPEAVLRHTPQATESGLSTSLEFKKKKVAHPQCCDISVSLEYTDQPGVLLESGSPSGV